MDKKLVLSKTWEKSSKIFDNPFIKYMSLFKFTSKAIINDRSHTFLALIYMVVVFQIKLKQKYVFFFEEHLI